MVLKNLENLWNSEKKSQGTLFLFLCPFLEERRLIFGLFSASSVNSGTVLKESKLTDSGLTSTEVAELHARLHVSLKLQVGH
jgi:hypothetical protein